MARLPAQCSSKSTQFWYSSSDPPPVRGLGASRITLEETMRDRFMAGGLLCISTMLGTVILLTVALVRPPCAADHLQRYKTCL